MSIEKWCFYLKITILIHSGTTGDSNCPYFVPCLVSNGAFKYFPGMARKRYKAKWEVHYDCMIEDINTRISMFNLPQVLSQCSCSGATLGFTSRCLPYTCPFCVRGFSGNNNLRGHREKNIYQQFGGGA